MRRTSPGVSRSDYSDGENRERAMIGFEEDGFMLSHGGIGQEFENELHLLLHYALSGHLLDLIYGEIS